MKSYIKFNWYFISELARLAKPGKWAIDAAKFYQWRTALANSQIEESYGIIWRDKILLEVGCGQKLAYTLPFAQQNRVVGIDTEPPFYKPYLQSFFSLVRYSGLYRTVKTSANAILGTRRAYRKALSNTTDFCGSYNFDLRRMNAQKLDFPDNHFDGVFSFSVFEHISDPEKALTEIRRVLKPNGVFYLDLHLFTAIYGDHDPRGDSESVAVPPWKHIRKSCTPLRVDSCYLNRIRLAEWRRMLEATFDTVRFCNIDGEADRSRVHLTSEIRQELSDYTDEELLTTTVIAVAKKDEH